MLHQKSAPEFIKENDFRSTHVAVGQGPRRSRLTRVIDSPGTQYRSIKSEEVIDAPAVTLPDCSFGYVVPSQSHALGHSQHGQVGTLQPEVYQMNDIS